jgi:NAD(P)-dependent dehydrogenase (short-subunit alcohol dehydrogenase family)
VDLLGQAYGAMAAIPHIKRRGGGALARVTSVLDRPFPLQSPYCASKHGVGGMLESFAWSWSGRAGPKAVPT